MDGPHSSHEMSGENDALKQQQQQSKTNVEEFGGRETRPDGLTARASASTSTSTDTSTSTSTAVDPKERLSTWGESSAHYDPGYGYDDGYSDSDDDVGDEDSEYELLLDPNRPDDVPLGKLSPDGKVKGEGAGDVGGEGQEGEEGPGEGEGDEEEEEEEENSPYPEVRAAVRNFDEDLPCNTMRAWTIGLTLVVFGAGLNTLLSLRAPSIGLSPLIAQIVAWPLGHAWARFVPKWQFNTFGLRWSLNPGPFNVKEHSIIVVMAGVSFSVAYATDIILAQQVFYKQSFGLLFRLLLVISTQSLGYGIAGMLRRFLVYPAAMIWPGTLVSVSLMNAMYDANPKPDPTVFGGSMPRYHWFGLVTLGAFFYYFIPGFLAQCLSSFAFVTWFAPNNPVINQLFGASSGLSLIPITFDWTQISGYVGSPLVPPWNAIANTLIGVVLFFVCLAATLHFSGVWYGQYLPINDATPFDNTGHIYNVTRVLTPEFTLDEAAYKNYSPLFLSTTFALSYGLSFAAIASLVVYTYLHHGQTIWRQWRNSSHEKPDIHMKLMRKYKEAPMWWYMSLFAIILSLGFFAVLHWHTHLTWWAFLLAVFIAFSFALPIGIVQAITNHQIGLNVLTEFIYGYIQPGRPLAMMIFKTFGYITMAQALNFVSDLKFGHYMKIPPRTMFTCQVVATTLSCVVQVFVLDYALANIENVCDQNQAERFSCPGGRVFFSASVIWGLLGPSRMFSPGQIYSGLFGFFALGAVVPVVVYYAARNRPKSPLRYLIAPVVFGGAGAIPPATPLNYLSWGIVGFAFQYVVKRRHFAWWSRLNFLTSSGLDLGLALSTLFIFFVFTLQRIDPPVWWGNTVFANTMDTRHKAVQVVLPPGETFGPPTW